MTINPLIHRSPSVGSLTKKIMAINPDLGVQDIIWIIRESTRAQGKEGGEYALAEIVDEQQALDLAKATLTPRK